MLQIYSQITQRQCQVLSNFRIVLVKASPNFHVFPVCLQSLIPFVFMAQIYSQITQRQCQFFSNSRIVLV